MIYENNALPKYVCHIVPFSPAFFVDSLQSVPAGCKGREIAGGAHVV